MRRLPINAIDRLAWQREHRRQNQNNDIKKYEKTPKGFLMRLYRNMKSRVDGVQKLKFHLYDGKELFNKEEFYSWALDQPEFLKLFNDYSASNYNRKLAPSVDRVDSSLGYTFDNVEWVTMSENSRRGVLSKHASKNLSDS